jgi:hypothetical protein
MYTGVLLHAFTYVNIGHFKIKYNESHMSLLLKEYPEIMTIWTNCATVHVIFACTQRLIYISEKSKFSTR